jgi:CRP-like cAMP-binding protein
VRKALYILADLEDSDIVWMARSATLERLDAGDMLAEAGREVTKLYFVVDGVLEVIAPTVGRIAELGMGEVVGEMSFVEKRPPSVTVRAMAPTEILAIPRDAMLAAFASDHGLAMRFYRALAVFLSDRLRAMSGPAEHELDEGLLDNVQQAGERFVRLVSLCKAPASQGPQGTGRD